MFIYFIILGIPIVEVNNTKIFQFILGFGGAFTDAAGINIKALPSKLQQHLLMSYFSEKGILLSLTFKNFSQKTYNTNFIVILMLNYMGFALEKRINEFLFLLFTIF